MLQKLHVSLQEGAHIRKWLLVMFMADFHYTACISQLHVAAGSLPKIFVDMPSPANLS